VLTKGFTTPSTGFKTIGIGSNSTITPQLLVHIIIDGKGVAVMDAHGRWEKIVA
jgi:hypothetical protein